jgi:site-specific DNA recombinase
MSKYITYCRKSSESEERQVLSIEAQLDELKQLAGKLHLETPEILTESRSAKHPGRPLFNEMMKKVSKGQVKGILCWKLDRLARNPIDGSALIWALDQGKISEIITPSGTFKNNSNDKFLMQLEFGMAKKYVDDLSDNVKRGNRAKLERGWLPGLPPLGYLNEPKERTIVKDLERFTLVRKMWDLLLQGVRPSKILKIANEEWGLRTRTLHKSGGRPLCLSEVYKMLGDPFYYGLIERKEGVYQGKHEPMITQDEYWRVQDILGRRGRPRPQTHEFAYTGLIRCGECGCMVTAEEKYNRFGSHYVYYRCTKKKRNTVCRQRYVNLKKLEAQIMECLGKLHVPDHLLRIAIEYLESEAKEEIGNAVHINGSQEKALRDCEKRLENLNQMRLKDLIDDQEYLRDKRRLLDEKGKLEDKLHHPDDQGITALELTEKTFLFAHLARDRFQDSSLDGKRIMLDMIGSNFLLMDKKLIIHAEKPFVIIQEGLVGLPGNLEPLEPDNNGFDKRKIEALTSVDLLMSALVNDVRTFFMNSPESESFKVKLEAFFSQLPSGEKKAA